MSLATRCTSCGTVFRVVQDQLKVSEGWVRCGRCSGSSTPLEGLFDLGRDAPPGWRRAATPVRRSAPDDRHAAQPTSAEPIAPARRRRSDAAGCRRRTRRERLGARRQTATRRRPIGRRTPVEPRQPGVACCGAIAAESPMRRSRLRSRADARVEPRVRASLRRADAGPRLSASRRRRRTCDARDVRRAAPSAQARWRSARRARRAGALAVLAGAAGRCRSATTTATDSPPRWPALRAAACRPGARSPAAARRAAPDRRHRRSRAPRFDAAARRTPSVSLSRCRTAARCRSRMPAVELTPDRWQDRPLVARACSRRANFGARRGRSAAGRRRRLAAARRSAPGRAAASPATPSSSSIPDPRDPQPHLPELHGSRDLRFARVRHHHDFRGPVRRPDPARPAAHPERVVPGAGAAPRVRRLRRQHRLQPRSCWAAQPLPMAAVGSDGADYLRAAAIAGASAPSSCAQSDDTYTAQAMIMTDRDNNQITAFHPGAMQQAHVTRGAARAPTSSSASSRPTAATRCCSTPRSSRRPASRSSSTRARACRCSTAPELRALRRPGELGRGQRLRGARCSCERTGWSSAEISRARRRAWW